VNGPGGRKRRLIVLALLIPGLMLSPSATVSSETNPTTPSTKRLAAKTARDDGTVTRSLHCMHVVRRGQSLSSIAAQHRVSRLSIVRANHLSSGDMLRVGQRLQIAGCRSVAGHRSSATGAARLEQGPILARVGPRRIPTRLFLAVPEWSDRKPVDFQWPVDGPIASTFGRRASGWHAGVDIQADLGTPVKAAAAGTVIVSSWERYYGNMIKVQHAGGFISVYAHTLENLVDVGDQVEAGGVIATVGRSGHASACHLHFEIRRDGLAYNPLHLLEARDAPVLASAPEPSDDDENESRE
jgi:murein DD-endopeptidase MepM/ murein hydrolase activator NlpD